MNVKGARNTNDAVRTHWCNSFIRVCSRPFA